MKKIRLDVDALAVSSFTTAAAAEQRGTVRGHSGYTCYMTIEMVNTLCAGYPESYWGEPTCGPPVEDTDPSVCPIPDQPTLWDATCPGVTGC